MLPKHVLRRSRRLFAISAGSICILTGPVLSKCCFTFSSQPLLPTSTAAYAISLTASSQSAVDSQGMVYKAVIKLPASYLIVAVPAGCSLLSPDSVNCQSSGQSRLVVSFPNVTLSSKGSILGADSVLVNGETCAVNTSCPTLSRSTASDTSSRSTPTTTSLSSSDNGQKGGSPSSSKSMIIGVSCAVVAVVLIAACVVLRRNMTSASSTGVRRKGSQYSLNRSYNGGASYGGPDSYELYREKTLKRQRSVREFHDAAAAKAAEDSVHRGERLPGQ
ncbi:hypothetical protein EDD21DRAFT_406632 [Dissophora ornata]|nr:hypothetical protein EDD21DRAFT_406632 [Dissophora ornata]